jgi:hypothetical protein
MVSLARMYATGQGVPKDPAEADRWMRKANEAWERLAEAKDLYRLNLLAREFATAEDSDYRDGSRAVELAEKVVRLSGRKIPGYLYTLAAAYAEDRKFQQAVATEIEAISLAGENQKAKADFTVRLRLYETNTPYHGFGLGTVIAPE